MGLLGAIGFSLALVSLTQIPYSAEGCRILSATASGPSSIRVKWEKQSLATNYFLDVRVKNNSDIAPIVATLPASDSETVVHGLNPGTEYSVTLKVFQFYFVVCMATSVATTVPDKSHIIVGKPLTSSSILVRWTQVPSANHYYLVVHSQATGETQNITTTELSAVVDRLQPFSNYDCYVYTANEAGHGRGSKVRTVTTLTRPPIRVTVTQTGRGKARVTWEPVDDVLLYRVAIRDTDEPPSSLTEYNVSDTMLDIHGIRPCSTYMVSVSSFSVFLVPSEPTDHTYTTNKLTPVSSVSVDYTCATHSATVHWTPVFGAEYYQASAKGDNGTELTCTGQGTSCQIAGLRCGQSYLVHVTPISDSCMNMLNATSATFQTVPCPPSNLELLRDCSSEVIVFSWERTNNTDHYMAKAVDSQGTVQECLTEDNSCYFTHTVCGRQYSFSVYSITGPCRSQTSSTVNIRTAPCIPKNLQTSADCGSDVLLSKWDLAEGALNYTVEAIGNKGTQTHYTCSSMSNSCAMQGVHCGDSLTIYITAFDNECPSPRILGPVAETVPCTPHNVSAARECEPDAVTVSWASSGGALFFIAMARDSDGVTHSCMSMMRSCKIEGLKCRTNYTAYVIAANYMCNSSESEKVTVETAACPPHPVAAALDCAANEALISWHSHPEINSFTATILDQEQGLLSCSATTTGCRVPNLKCSQNYTVTVQHHDGVCTSRPSEPVYMESVPCGPNVTQRLDCPSQVLTLGWSATANADGYTAVISSDGRQTSFATTEPALTIGTLECGLDYTLGVTSFSGACVSHPTVLPVGEMPCVPTNVAVDKGCNENFAHVTWHASPVALSYRATARIIGGRPLLCSSNGTSCRMEGLVCSRVYNVSVTAMNNDCASNESAAEVLRTEPCAPSRLEASVHCANNSATLTWSGSPNAVSYTGTAAGTAGDVLTCDAGANLGCQLGGLLCGEEYTFTVSASDGSCRSPDSEPVTLSTAPCAVQSVLNTLDCETNVLTVSWSPGSRPVHYSAVMLSRDGSKFHCMTTDSTCVVTNFTCGQQYTVTVTAISSTCVGQSSVPEIVNTVPCTPANVAGDLECSTNTWHTSWDAAAGATSYVSTLTGAGGLAAASCRSTNRSCTFAGLQCAQTYSLTVVARNDRCNSSESAAISTTTAPCDPTGVTAALHCPSGVVTVSWGASAGASRYTALAEAAGHVDSCASASAAGTSCELRELRCGEVYAVTVLAGDGACNSSVLARTNVTTAPCAPVIRGHSLDCVSNRALVTWEEDEDALSVTVNATDSLGEATSCTSSANGTCVLDELLCGHAYTVHAVAQGPQCQSEPSSTFQLVTAPCTPSNVGYTYSCETGIAFLSWDETLGRQTFYAHVQSEGHATDCTTGQTDCALPSLLCGHLYNVTVIAEADHCNSSVPGVTQIQTAPCPPTNVSASLVCDGNAAAVSWEHSPGATHYEVTANSRSGDVRACTTNGTSCHVADMLCAQTYLITVTPYSSHCKGFDSSPRIYVAGPCPPTDVDVSLQCDGNVGNVTWTAALHADFYVATAAASTADEHEHNCTAGGTGCQLTGLHCGVAAVVTVVTVERGCTSEPSLPFAFQTVICPPAGVTGVTTCANNDITVSWDPSPESAAAGYFVRSHGAAGDAATALTSHVLTGLQCGELHTLLVAASDAQCTSVYSEPIEVETVPCPPTNLTARAVCGTKWGRLTWAASEHAVSYTATVTGLHGHVSSCTSNSTSCSVSLDCGKQYSAVVVASSAACDSGAGASLSFESAPCLPDSVMAELDCDANSFEVFWMAMQQRADLGDVSAYTAIAIGSDDTRATCDSGTTSCVIPNLACGLSYSIVVASSSVQCGAIEGSDYSKQSAPCKPDAVQVDLQCSTNRATVTWGNAGPDQTHEVSAEDSRGAVTTCNSSSPNCTFERLACGESYVVSVVGRTDSCSSEPAVAERFHTAPCVPTHVSATVDCETGIASVTWDSASGATSYTVYARGSLGHSDECNNTDTNCDFTRLACGQDYAVTVLARHDSCVSVISDSVTVTTRPCPHSGLSVALDCDTNTAVLSWTPGVGNLYYNASADSFGATHRRTCDTHGSSCNISSLRCGESYKVTVSGKGGQCPSREQDWHRIRTAPCPPTGLAVDSSCESNDVSVSWTASAGSASYTAVAESAEGLQWSCSTSGTACQIAGLPCGQQYTVYAVGVDDDCTGAKSDMEVIRTAPCVPQSVQTDLDCLAAVLNVTWQSTGHVVEFRASAANGNGHVSVCATDGRHCEFHGVQCGRVYSVEVVAQDEACNSSYSAAEQVVTAPCPLATFHPAVDCATGVVSVTWGGGGAPGVVHTVSASDAAGLQHSCSGGDGGCELATLECGTVYSVVATPSRNECVGSDSPTQMITTVPCVPRLSEVEIDCLTNSAWVMYQASAGAQDYVVAVSDGDGATQTFECNSTSDGTCSMPPLACSQNLTFTLQARDQQCSSGPSNAVTTETAPCPPEDVGRTIICDNQTASISWSAVPGAVSYTATVELSSGVTACCTTSGTGCDVAGLLCSEMYVLLITAEGRTCNSSQSQVGYLRTAPCVPQNLRANLSCGDNAALASWDFGAGLGELYRVTAVGADGHAVECTSLQSQCKLTGLRCGTHYTATVTAEHSDCRSEPSDSVVIKTVPCTPANVSSATDCATNTLVVSWSASPGADSYVATVQDSNGQSTACRATTEGSCSVAGVACGQTYHVSVVSSDGRCDSPPTAVVDTPSVPCEASRIEALMDCYTQVAVVEWLPADGALRYEVTATATAADHSVVCAADAGHCELEGLLCGESYAVAVEAVGESCSSVARMTGELVTQPCVPEEITAQYSGSIGQVLWDAVAGADYYTVEGVTEQGLAVACNTTDTYCPVYDLACGQRYDVAVTANNHVCRGLSTSNDTVAITTEPCPPSNVNANVLCERDAATVSWEVSLGAVSYEVDLAGRDGHHLSCSGPDTFCDVEGLHCGVVYYVGVVAVGETLRSDPSTTFLLHAAPCTPENVAAAVDCLNDTARVSWSLASGASSYVATAVGAHGHRASCDAVGDRCDLTGLLCGQTYNVSLATVSDHCQTETRTDVAFSTRPCKPSRVSVDLPCGTRNATVHWTGGEGAEYHVATATDGSGAARQCNTTGSTCEFPDLDCGEAYAFSVTGCSGACCGDASGAVEGQTGPCRPTGLSVSGSCDNHTVALDWSAADGASVYVVTAAGDLGYVRSYQTNETTVEAELLCGQLFRFTVRAQGERCDSAASLPEEFKTGPCVPEHVQSVARCENSRGVVTWAESDGAESYMAFAVGADGHTHPCLSNATTCAWDDLHCGEEYSVHVLANDYLCSSMPSASASIRMAPCIPENLESSLDCTTKVGSMTWNASETAELYVVTAEAGSGHRLQLSTNETLAFISDFQCGQEYLLTVQAVDAECTSGPSLPSTLNTEPCTPTDVLSFMNCFSNIAVVSWKPSAGSQFYTATLTQEDGLSTSCYSDSVQCGVPNVNCGQSYAVTVIGSNEQCYSDPSEVVTLQSVPCVPADVVVTVDCSRNEAAATWSASGGALSYGLRALSADGHVSRWDSEDPTCTLTNLTCGQSYSVQVVARDDICSSLPSAETTFQSVPCTPTGGDAALDCLTNSAVLAWSDADGALEYTATAECSMGHVLTCTSDTAGCALTDLHCGETYNVSVVASDGNCSSPASAVFQVEAVPCMPQKVKAEMLCSNDSAVVSWEEEEDGGVSSYVARALGPDGHLVTCHSDATSCLLPSMHCGQLYNLSVTAEDGRCDNSRTYLDLQSVPCRPTNVAASLQCHSSSAAVTWERAGGASSYRVVGVAEDGSHQVACDSNGTRCDLGDLRCGQTYAVRVLGLDETCSSVESDEAHVHTAPCAPQGVAVEAVCADSAIAVSWSPDPDAQSFRVVAVSDTLATHSCTTSGTSCTIDGLPCGQDLKVTVVAVRDDCESEPSAVVETCSAPCAPSNVKGRLDCVSNDAWVTWDDLAGAHSYSVRAHEAEGHNSSCVSASSPCSVPDLKCGTVYTFHVTSANSHCRSNATVFELETGACNLTSVSIETQCGGDTILVGWEQGDNTPMYLVSAEGHDQSILSCNSTSDSCELRGVRCGMRYSVIVSGSSNKCSSLRSPPKKIRTAPCVPDDVTVSQSCDGNGATITWGHSQVATSYLLTATGLDGHVVSCNTSACNCSLSGLRCGQPYDFNVTASGDGCTSEPYASSFSSVPCEPAGLAVDFDCETNSAALSWSVSGGVAEYFGRAQAAGEDALYCAGAAASCTIEGLVCGEVYNFSVEASNGVCNSSVRRPLEVGAAPCPPAGLEVRSRRINHGPWAQASWDAVGCPGVEYLVEVSGRIQNSSRALMDVSSYWLRRTFYELPVPCGTAYSLTVRSRNTGGVGEPSGAFSGVSAPCAPQNVKYDWLNATGDARSATLSWDASALATGYTVYNGSGAGRAALCDTAALHCDLADFDPDAVEVTASNAGGESDPNRNVTGPGSRRRRRDAPQMLMVPHLNNDLDVPIVVSVGVHGVSMYVKWKPVADADHYALAVEESNGNRTPDLVLLAGDSRFHEVTDLRPWTTYCVRLSARNALSESDYSAPICKTTDS